MLRPVWEEEEQETSLVTVLPTPEKRKGVGGKGCIMTVRGMKEARGAWAWAEGGGGGACKGRREGGGPWEERREGEEAGERHWPGEKSFMPKEGLGDDGSFDGMVGLMLTCCTEGLEVLGG